MSQFMRLLVPCLAAASSLAFAGRQDCATQAGAAVTAGPVNADAVFTTGSGFISITVSNLQADPTSAGQLLSGLAFTLSDGQTTGSLGPNSANLRKVQGGGVFTDFGPSSTGGLSMRTLTAVGDCVCSVITWARPVRAIFS